MMATSYNSVSSVSTSGSKVISTGSSHCRLVSRDHSTVRVGDKVGVQVERSRVSVMGDGGSVDSSDGGGMDSSDGSIVTVCSMGTMGGTQGSQMGSTGSSHGRLIHRDHGPVRVTDQAVEAGSVTMATIAGSGRSHKDTGRENLETEKC